MSADDIAARLWRLLLSQPKLVATHMGRYAFVLRDDTKLAMAYLRYCTLMWALCLGCSLLFVGLTGVALLLWGTMQEQAQAHAWVLCCVPCAPLLGAMGFFLALQRKPPVPLWAGLKAQVCTDLALLETTKQTHSGWLIVAAALLGAGLTAAQPRQWLRCTGLLSSLLSQLAAQLLAHMNLPKQ
jgi:hypothetical protein